MRIGSSFASNMGASTKYAIAYRNATTHNSGSPLIYTVSKTGDGIKETYVKRNGYAWFGNASNFGSLSGPFFGRGGMSGAYGSSAGIFSSKSSQGIITDGYSFRTVLCH